MKLGIFYQVEEDSTEVVKPHLRSNSTDMIVAIEKVRMQILVEINKENTLV